MRVRSPEDILDWLGGYIAGEFDSEDAWVASGFEDESDNPDRYEYDEDEKGWFKKE